MARTCTWDGGGADALASNGVNWDTDTAPVAGDSIVFPTTTKACTWDLNISLVTLTINSGYVQTITQNSGANMTFTGAVAINGACTVTCNAGATFSGSSTFNMAAGTFNQGGAFSCTSTFTVAAATFVGSSATMSTGAVVINNNATALTATSGVWTLNGSWTQSNNTTFTHHSGTIKIAAASTFNDARSTFNLVQIDGGGANIAVTLSSGTTVPLGATPTTTTGTSTLTIAGVVTWSGTWTATGTISTSNGSTLTGTSTPQITINQSLTITNVTTITNAIGTITFNGTANSTITDASDLLSGTTYTVNKTSTGTFTIAASTNARFGASPTITMGSGAVTVTGTFTWTGGAVFTTTGLVTVTGTLTGTSTPTLSINAGLTTSAATITNTIGTVTFTGGAATTYTDTGDKLSASTFVLTFTGNNTCAVAASTNMRLGASPTSTVGTSTLTVTGILTFSGAWTHTGSLTVTGTLTGTSTPTLSVSRSLTTSGATITNTIGTVTMAGAAATNTYTDTSAALGSSTFVINCTGGNFSLAASTTAQFGNSPTLTVGSGSAFVCSGVAVWSGTMTITRAASSGNILTTAATTTLTGTSTPVILLQDGGASINASTTFTNTFGVTMAYAGSTGFAFAGAGLTYGIMRRTGSGTGALTISGSNTFTTIRDNDGSVAHTLQFTAGTTQTVTNWLVDNLVTCQSTSNGSAWTLSITSPIYSTGISLQDSVLSGSLGYATNSTNVSGNVGWSFSAPATGGPGGLHGFGGASAYQMSFGFPPPQGRA